MPAAILNKPGRPDDEWVQLRRHPETAARPLSPLHGWLGPWMPAAEQHHEHYAGTGYPQGAEGGGDLARRPHRLRRRPLRDHDRSPPLQADHERGRRPRGAGRNAGTQFDPVVCRAFLNMSLGRLWRGLGFAAWLSQLPMLTPFAGTLSRWGGKAASMTATVATGAVLAASGLLAILDVGFGGAHTPAVSRLPARPAPMPAPAPAPAPDLGLPRASTPAPPPPAPPARRGRRRG